MDFRYKTTTHLQPNIPSPFLSLLLSLLDTSLSFTFTFGRIVLCVFEMAPRTRRSHTATTDTHPNGASDANGVGFKGPTRTYISTQRDAIDPDLTQPGVRGSKSKTLCSQSCR